METSDSIQAIAFDGARRIASGSLAEVTPKVRLALDRGAKAGVLVFDFDSSAVIDLDLRPGQSLPRAGSRPADAEPRPGPGRPRLGVVPREVTLLPRHWEWLSDQPGGASVTLRKLVDQARQTNLETDRVRKARESAYRFMTAMAGDRPGYEEATRALFAGDRRRFETHTDRWPADIKAHARSLFDRTMP